MVPFLFGVFVFQAVASSFASCGSGPWCLCCLFRHGHHIVTLCGCAVKTKAARPFGFNTTSVMPLGSARVFDPMCC